MLRGACESLSKYSVKEVSENFGDLEIDLSVTRQRILWPPRRPQALHRGVHRRAAIGPIAESTAAPFKALHVSSILSEQDIF